MHTIIVGVLLVLNFCNIFQISKSAKRKLTVQAYYCTVILLTVVNKFFRNHKYMTLDNYINWGLYSIFIGILTTRFNYALDRRTLAVRLLIINIGNIFFWKMSLLKTSRDSILVVLIFIITSFVINTYTRYSYAEFDCLRRSNAQLFQNFSEIPDPIIFMDITTFQIIHFNLNSESLLNKDGDSEPVTLAIDLIHGEDEKSKFRQMINDLQENSAVESKEVVFQIQSKTEKGAKLIKYNTIIWKSYWKDLPVLGVRFKPIRRDQGEIGSEVREFYASSLQGMEQRLRNVMSSISGDSRNMKKHL